jgi:hypothetical protein
MARAIAVLNAGWSSLKFSIFRDQDGELAPSFRGQLERVFTAPRFIAFDPAGTPTSETKWPEGTRVGDPAERRTHDRPSYSATDTRVTKRAFEQDASRYGAGSHAP